MQPLRPPVKTILDIGQLQSVEGREIARCIGSRFDQSVAAAPIAPRRGQPTHQGEVDGRTPR